MTEEEWQLCADPDSLLEFLELRVTERKRRLLSVHCCQRVFDIFSDQRLTTALIAAEALADGIIRQVPARVYYTTEELRSELKSIALTAEYEEENYSAAAEAQAAARHSVARAVLQTIEADLLSSSSFESLVADDPEFEKYRNSWLPSWKYAAWARFAAARARLLAEEWEILPETERELAKHKMFRAKWRQARDSEQKSQTVLIKEMFGNPFRPSTIAPDWLTWNNATIPKLAQTIYDDRRYDILPILGDALDDAGCGDEQMLEHCRGPGPHVRGCWVVDLILGKN